MYRFIFGLFLKLRKSTFQEKTKDLWYAEEAFLNVRKVILHYLCYIARRFEIHSALELSALLDCRLAA